MAGDHIHSHAAADGGALDGAFRWAVALNAGYVIVEAGSGLYFGSLALLADAAHNLTDVAGLLIAWGAAVVARRPPMQRFTYGLGRSTILAALANAVAILVGVGAVLLEAVQRLSSPQIVPALPVLLVAAAGIAINTGTALLFRRERGHDLNAEGAFLHMAADAAVSAGVVLSAVVILATGWNWVDPAAAIIVSLVIAWTAFGLLKSSMALSLDGVPASVDLEKVGNWLRARPGIAAVHDLHIWALSTTSTAMSAHLVMSGGHPGDAFIDAVAGELERNFAITHATLQIELGDGGACRLIDNDGLPRH
ncbi:cation diffusion facilitator family transporter [Ferrovibrio xuzhouensis]|uniref:Cation diffusion facilitator family transporter n=1 Tax=Ferrovibrio xuzhouensis TaxID=1576914 RepID=A0ABV7VCE5_9PROT